MEVRPIVMARCCEGGQGESVNPYRVIVCRTVVVTSVKADLGHGDQEVSRSGPIDDIPTR